PWPDGRPPGACGSRWHLLGSRRKLEGEEPHGIEDEDRPAVAQDGRAGDPRRRPQGGVELLDDDLPDTQDLVGEEGPPPAAVLDRRPRALPRPPPPWASGRRGRGPQGRRRGAPRPAR